MWGFNWLVPVIGWGKRPIQRESGNAKIHLTSMRYFSSI